MKMMTKNKYGFFEVTSAMQKAIRRNQPGYAGFWAHELLESGYYNYVWTRLLVVSAEDCAGIITQEIEALQRAYMKVRDPKNPNKGRIFLSKAVLILCKADKSRDADHLQNYCRDHMVDIDDDVLAQQLTEAYSERVESGMPEIPLYAYDVHTSQGRSRGATKEQFFMDEQNCLKPVSPENVFDHYPLLGSPEQAGSRRKNRRVE